MDRKLVDIKGLVAELAGQSREVVGEEKLLELFATFKNIVGSSERPSLDVIDKLPEWFLVEALEMLWPDVKDKDFFLHHINTKFDLPTHRDFKMQIAASVTIVDPPAGIRMLERMDDKKARKKGILLKSYIDPFLKHFVSGDARPLNSIIEYKFENARILNKASLQFFEIFFGEKKSLNSENKNELQVKILKWIIANNLYLPCIQKFSALLTKEVRLWPMSMMSEYRSIQELGASVGITFDILEHPLQGLQTQKEYSDDDKQAIFKKALDAELLEEIGKRLSLYNEQNTIKVAKINEQSSKIFDLQRKIESLSQRITNIEQEKNQLVLQKESIQKTHALERGVLEEKNSNCQKAIAERDLRIDALEKEFESLKNDCASKINEITKRIEIESEHAQKQLTEKIHDLLVQDFNDMNRLGDNDNHRTAKIMIGHIFGKLSQLGITFSNN